jgi:methylmalonyl-CoA/ethylmalonyl-CoA epimerase
MPELVLDHVAVAVRSLRNALALYRDALGGEFLMGGDAGVSWRWAQFRYPGGGKIEILEPLGEGFLSKFLDRHGEGLHHVTFKTDDLEAAIAQVEAQGYELVDIDLESEHWKEAFLRPSKAHGTLIQLAQSKYPDEVVASRPGARTLEELLD